MRSLRHRALALSLAATSVIAAAGPALADDYTDEAYRTHDLDNMERAVGRHAEQATDPEYGEAFIGAGADSFLRDAGQAANDVRAGRVYLGGGRYVPGGSAGDPRYYYDINSTEIAFVSRTGAKLTGHVWGGTPVDGVDRGPRPGVVITSGSIQGYEAMYFWAARELARRGYVVLTWDVQGQGRSEGVGHAPGSPTPTGDGVPFQQAGNFYDGTIDALNFLLSTPSAEYLPGGGEWTSDDRDAQKAHSDGVEALDWVNPFWEVLDRNNIGLAGHSLGGSAIGEVQQCSDMGDIWAEVALCDGRSYPIRAAVGWDSLPSGVTPVVPGMNQQGDGYFFNVTPAFNAPDPDAHLATHATWTEAGIDTYSFSVRGGTHLEWTDLPYVLPATTYGTRMATDYTAAWMDRYLSTDRDVNASAQAFLLEAPAADCEQPHSGTYMSARYRSAMALTDVADDAVAHVSDDLRTFNSGWAATGDWAGANEEAACL